MSGFSKTYDILETLYQQSPTGRPLTASVDAVSLAFFSFQFDSTPASHLSQAKYVSALPLLNKALRAPESATSNSTLLAVLLLDLFEKITNKHSRFIGSWMSHINGALALVNLREKAPLRDYTSLRLSARLTINLLISCVSANSPVPPALTKLRSALEPFVNKDDPKWQLNGLVVKYANLKGAIQDGCISSADTILRATNLDLEFASLAEHMPTSWLYSTTHLETTSERVFENCYDNYPDYMTTQVWNVLRVMRMLLNDTIRTFRASRDTAYCTNCSASHAPFVATSRIDNIAKDICASAPQLTRDDSTLLGSKANCATQSLQCYTLLFPLYVAGMYASSATQIKPWIVKQLRFMADEMRIRNALVVADILEKSDGTCPWDVYAVLGSYAFAA